MMLRTKLKIFVLFFLLVTAVFVTGSFVIFEHLSGNFDILRSSVEKHALQEELSLSIADFVKTAKEWAVTGDRRFKTAYRRALSDVDARFQKLGAIVSEKEEVEAIRRSSTR